MATSPADPRSPDRPPERPGARAYTAPTHSPASPEPVVPPPHGSSYTAPSEPSRAPPTEPATPLTDLIRHRLDRAKALIAEAREYATHFALAKLDRAAYSVRKALLYTALGMIGAVAGLAALVYATVLLLSGLAGAVAVLLGDRVWLGNLIVGAVVLTGAGVGAWLGVSSLLGKTRAQLRDKYEARKADQRARFGHDVSSPPTAPTHA